MNFDVSQLLLPVGIAIGLLCCYLFYRLYQETEHEKRTKVMYFFLGLGIFSLALFFGVRHFFTGPQQNIEQQLPEEYQQFQGLELDTE